MQLVYQVGQFVYSTKLQCAVEILEEYNPEVMFSCSLSAANRYSTIYTRLSSGNEVFETLEKRERIEARLQNILNNLKNM